MPWKRLELSPEEMSEYALLQRIYKPKTRKWPILFISIYKDALYWPQSDGIRLVCSKITNEHDKRSGEANIPISLIPDVIEMLNEAKDILTKE